MSSLYIRMARFDFVIKALLFNFRRPDLKRGKHPLLRTLSSPSSSLAEVGRGEVLRMYASFGPFVRDLWSFRTRSLVIY